jgi:hypothetical protein
LHKVTGGIMRSRTQRLLRLGAVAALGAVLLVVGVATAASGQARHVRWDIISLVGGAPPGPINPGGVASAKAPDDTMITLTGGGTFVAPGGRNGGSHAVTGGGTWQTFDAAGAPTGSGTYEVKELVSFEFANFQSPTPVFVDDIADVNQRAKGSCSKP